VRFPDQVPVPPANETLPPQEEGVRLARALPYSLDARGSVADDHAFRIEFHNTGEQTAVFQVRQAGSTDAPRSYTIEPGKRLTGTWAIEGQYDLSVYGPNGFYRGFNGRVSGRPRVHLDVRPGFDDERGEVELDITNRSTERVRVSVRNRYTSRSETLALTPGEHASERWSLSRTNGWYDLTITADDDDTYRYQLAGHLENGEDSISDPLMGGLID
jgi:phospholipase C